MATITQYMVERPDHSVVSGPFDNSGYDIARSEARRFRAIVVEYEYEFSDSKVVDDFSAPGPDDADIVLGRDDHPGDVAKALADAKAEAVTDDCDITVVFFDHHTETWVFRTFSGPDETDEGWEP